MDDQYRLDLFGATEPFPGATSNSVPGAHAARHQLAAWSASSSPMPATSPLPASYFPMNGMASYAPNGATQYSARADTSRLPHEYTRELAAFDSADELKAVCFEPAGPAVNEPLDDAHEDASEQHRKRGRAGQAAAAGDAQTVQEKNRQAQARFRQRQKDKVAVLDGQVQELKQEKARLVEDNKALQKSKAILEKVYTLKEEQVQVLQGANGILQSQGSNGTLSIKNGSATCGITAEQLILSWKECVKALSGLLIKASMEGDEQEDARQQIDRIMGEVAGTCKRVCFEHPEAAQALVCARFNDTDPEVAPQSVWRETIAQVGLSSAQQDELLALGGNYRRDMAASAIMRKELLNAMVAATPAQVVACSMQSRLSLENKRYTTELQEVLRREHQTHSEYMVGVLDKVLTRMQLAQASVTCYPYFPDPLKMAEIIEEDMSAATAAPDTSGTGSGGDASA